jgi:hypothetical protein
MRQSDNEMGRQSDFEAMKQTEHSNERKTKIMRNTDLEVYQLTDQVRRSSCLPV